MHRRPLIGRWFKPQAVSTRQLHDRYGVIGCASITHGQHGSGFKRDPWDGPWDLDFHRDLMVSFLGERPSIWSTQPAMTQEYQTIDPGFGGHAISDIEDPWMDAMRDADKDDALATRAFMGMRGHLTTMRELRQLTAIWLYGYPLTFNPEYRPKGWAVSAAVIDLVDVVCPAVYVAGNPANRARRRADAIAQVRAALSFRNTLVCPTICKRYGGAGNTDERLMAYDLMADMVLVATQEYTLFDGTMRKADGICIYEGWDAYTMTPASVAADNALIELVWDALKP